MPPDQDAFWDELGVSWRASISDQGLMSSRLQARLKLQSALLSAGAIAAAALGLIGFSLAAWALWLGLTSQIWNFIARGATLAAVSVLAIMASLALRIRDSVKTRSLREMLRISIARTERLIGATDLACYSLVILAVGGMAGYTLRTRLGRPPSISPVEDLLALALAGLALIWFRRSQARALRKYHHVRQIFDSEDDVK
jgi:hypothetical protein